MTKTTKKLTRPKTKSLFTPARLGIAAVVAITLLVIYAVWQSITAQNEKSRPLEGLETFPNVQQGHKDGILTYAQTPPVGGEHNPAWQNCGVYTVAIANENGVHSLEHGAVWITYQPHLPIAQVEQLQQLTRQSRYRLVSPYPDLPSPIVISAWGFQLKLEKTDDPRLQQFIQRYEQSPAAPEPGAVCTGGVGQPL